MDARTIYATGLAIGHSLRNNAGPKVILGRDTRESSTWIAATISAGLRDSGARVESAGVVPTPAVAFARNRGFDAGVVISASHNPWRDNGIKLFGGDGFKLPDAMEASIEEEIQRHAEEAVVSDVSELARVEDNAALSEHYIQFLIESVPGLELDGLPIVADCANGAAAAVAPESFARLGARTQNGFTLLNISPDGRNINDGCGALHPQWVADEVQKRGAALGLTFDGDADRCMLAGAHGNVINGDAILLMAARDLKARGMLTGDLVVATTMSNMGLEAALKRSGIRMLRAPVWRSIRTRTDAAARCGSRWRTVRPYSPHLATTGDGLLTALVILDLIARTGKSVDELTADLKVYPQVIVNVRVREKRPLESIPAVAERIHAAEDELKDSGRVVIRYSGTEALARIMIEAESEEAMRRHADAIASAIRSELGT